MIEVSNKKFCGYCHEFGNFVYGKLLRHDYYNTKGEFLYVEYYIEGTDEDYGDCLPEVTPETVAQFDKLVDNLGQEYIAKIQNTLELIVELRLKESTCKLYFDLQVRNYD